MKETIEKIGIAKRKHPRIPVRIKLENWPLPQLKGYSIFSHNISLGGMMIEIIPNLQGNIDLKVGDIINISFLLPTRKDYLNISSKIAWKKDKVQDQDGKEATHIGIKFAAMSDILESVITDFLKKESAENLGTE